MNNDEVAKHGTVLLTETQKARTDTLLDESEGVHHFVSSTIQSDPVKDLTTDEIIDKYAIYCADPDRGWFFNRRKVERELPNIMLQLFKTVPNCNISRNDKRARGYRNVTFVP
jgi:hypothetical protein